MKKLLFLVVLNFCSYLLSAQTECGIKGGINFANLRYEAQNISDNGDNLLGFHIGFFIENRISEHVSIQPEIMFSRQGNQIPNSNFSEELDYVNVPILFKYLPIDKFGIYAGPQFGLLIASNKINGIKVQDFYNDYDLSFAFGCEFNISKNVRLGGRYNLGLSNIDSSDDTGELKTKNSVGQIYIGITL